MTGSTSGSGGSGAASGSSSAGSASGSSASGSSSGSSSSTDISGCGATKLLKPSDDLTAPGPWTVGVKTAQLSMTGGMRPVEIWYPAQPGSQSGKSQATYDPGSWLPASEEAKIPASGKITQTCNCYRDLPVDSSHGPYPAVIFIHGTASFRTASLSSMTAWASRGFVVVAADHAGLFLTDFLATQGGCSGGTGVHYPAFNTSADVDAEIAALTKSSGDFAFLGTSVDMTRIGISGHSQGAHDAATDANKPNVQVDMPLADFGGATAASSTLKSVLIVAGMSDSVVPFASDTTAYSGSTAATKRLVGITGGDHLDVTDLCTMTDAAGQTAIQVATAAGVCGASTVANLAKCGTVSPVTAGPQITNYVTTAALEETLHCLDRSAAFNALKTKFSQVGQFQHAP